MGVGSRLPTNATNLYSLRGPETPITAGLGVPWIHYPNHNVSADVLAAVEVMSSGMVVDI